MTQIWIVYLLRLLISSTAKLSEGIPWYIPQNPKIPPLNHHFSWWTPVFTVFPQRFPSSHRLLDDAAGDTSSLEVVDHHGTAQDVARGLEDEGMGMGLGEIMGWTLKETWDLHGFFSDSMGYPWDKWKFFKGYHVILYTWYIWYTSLV